MLRKVAKFSKQRKRRLTTFAFRSEIQRNNRSLLSLLKREIKGSTFPTVRKAPQLRRTVLFISCAFYRLIGRARLARPYLTGIASHGIREVTLAFLRLKFAATWLLEMASSSRPTHGKHRVYDVFRCDNFFNGLPGLRLQRRTREVPLTFRFPGRGLLQFGNRQKALQQHSSEIRSPFFGVLPCTKLLTKLIHWPIGSGTEIHFAKDPACSAPPSATLAIFGNRRHHIVRKSNVRNHVLVYFETYHCFSDGEERKSAFRTLPFLHILPVLLQENNRRVFNKKSQPRRSTFGVRLLTYQFTYTSKCCFFRRRRNENRFRFSLAYRILFTRKG